MADLFENPMGTDGFEFVEYATNEPKKLEVLFEKMGFTKVASHRSKDIILMKQNDINFIINSEPESFAQQFAKEHGPSACAMAFRVKDAAFAYKRAIEKGATACPTEANPMELNIPAIEGIGGSRLYFVDRYDGESIYDVDFKFIDGWEALMAKNTTGLTYLDHLTHNVFRGKMDHWAGFYEDFFNFREIRYFDIEGKLTGLVSKAMTSPCGKIRIPLNESRDDKSQIEEFLKDYNGEGIQHIALGSTDIYDTVDQFTENGVALQETNENYFNQIDARLPGHNEPVEELRKRSILIDGAPTEGQGLLLQIFTANQIGPIFFELIQRKGNEGFGEGNFQALFESLEEDQIRRGVLEDVEAK
ncbi:MAG: 4-hydroxyphenylpyruvate dioxygenase [Robiginitomaculum sp.]|nr:MAG: 4-hydroxyphenylpyruvate dioxygenase [Robiginitomaculum sp.]